MPNCIECYYETHKITPEQETRPFPFSCASCGKMSRHVLCLRHAKKKKKFKKYIYHTCKQCEVNSSPKRCQCCLQTKSLMEYDVHMPHLCITCFQQGATGSLAVEHLCKWIKENQSSTIVQTTRKMIKLYFIDYKRRTGNTILGGDDCSLLKSGTSHGIHHYIQVVCTECDKPLPKFDDEDIVSIHKNGYRVAAGQTESEHNPENIRCFLVFETSDGQECTRIPLKKLRSKHSIKGEK
jgi:hypothetical protein